MSGEHVLAVADKVVNCFAGSVSTVSKFCAKIMRTVGFNFRVSSIYCEQCLQRCFLVLMNCSRFDTAICLLCLTFYCSLSTHCLFEFCCILKSVSTIVSLSNPK